MMPLVSALKLAPDFSSSEPWLSILMLLAEKDMSSFDVIFVSPCAVIVSFAFDVISMSPSSFTCRDVPPASALISSSVIVSAMPPGNFI